jgi:hypothetical protein
MTLILSGTDGLSDVDGSAATPAIRGTDTNTGIFFPAADTIAFAEGGAEVARFDSSGNLGIGTSSPDFQLQVEKTAASTFVSVVSGTSNTAGVLLGDTDSATIGRIEYDNASNFMALYTNGSERARIDSSGNFQFNSGYGSVATAYGCRAWVNFNGTGTVAIRASGNVTSITDNGTGDYTVNFTTAMPDANFAATGSAGGVAGANPRILGCNIKTTTSVRVSSGQTGLQDESEISVAIFR